MKGCTNLVEVYIRKYSSPTRTLSMSICSSCLRKGNWEKELKWIVMMIKYLSYHSFLSPQIDLHKNVVAFGYDSKYANLIMNQLWNCYLGRRSLSWSKVLDTLGTGKKQWPVQAILCSNYHSYYVCNLNNICHNHNRLDIVYTIMNTLVICTNTKMIIRIDE